MYRFFAPLILFAYCFTQTEAQQVRISPQSHDDFSLGFSRVIGQDESGYYVLTSNLSLDITSDRVGFRSRKYRLGYFDLQLALKWDQMLNATPNDATLDAITFFNGQVMLVSSLFNKNDARVSYRIEFIGPDGKSAPAEGFKAEFILSGNDYEKCRVITSLTRDRFALVTREIIGDHSLRVHTTVVDDKMSSSRVKSFNIPWPEKTFDWSRIEVSNKGDLALLGVNSERIKLLSSRRKNDYFLWYAPSEADSFTFQAVAPDKNITGLDLAFDNINQQIVLAGFYTEKSSLTGSGILFATQKMDSTLSWTIKNKPLEGQQNLRIKGERNLESGMSLVSYPIQRIILRHDGGAVIIAEASYTTEFSYYDSFSQSFSRRIEYHFDNIILISLNSDGHADWSTIIEKRQSSLDDGGVFLSFCSMVNNEQMVIVYNESAGRRNRIIPVSVTQLGQASRMKGIQQVDGMLLLPRAGKQVSANELLVPALIKRKLYLVMFSFDNS
jgi:hypothetical protein